ncbi:MAG TPA: multicopper oxidase domain-containing protein [Candidatus Limnocylindria bacterium]|nr:multicopper oxidase domain-containing protein [Candidatus Limnocylindria bacterium]
MDDQVAPPVPEPPDPEGIFARRTLLGVMGVAFGGALGVAVLGATRNLPVAAAAAAPTATPAAVDHSLHAAASPVPSGSPVDHDAQMEAAVTAFPAKTRGIGLQELSSTVVDGAREFRLTCAPLQWEVTPGVVVNGLAFNGQIPGPIIRATEGERIRVIVQNDLAESTGVHWHGQRVPSSQDGVPFLTQPPIKPGATYVYEFTAGPFGSHMYHSHHNATEQVGLGMLGPLIVVPKERTVDPSFDKDELFILNDALGGFTINGKGFPATAPYTATLGQRIRFRFMNEGQGIHPVHLHGLTFEVFARDGYPLPAPFRCDTLNVAPGERWDAIVVADAVGAWAFHCHILGHAEGRTGMFGMVTALLVSA